MAGWRYGGPTRGRREPAARPAPLLPTRVQSPFSLPLPRTRLAAACAPVCPGLLPLVVGRAARDPRLDWVPGGWDQEPRQESLNLTTTSLLLLLLLLIT